MRGRITSLIGNSISTAKHQHENGRSIHTTQVRPLWPLITRRNLLPHHRRSTHRVQMGTYGVPIGRHFLVHQRTDEDLTARHPCPITLGREREWVSAAFNQ